MGTPTIPAHRWSPFENKSTQAMAQQPGFPAVFPPDVIPPAFSGVFSLSSTPRGLFSVLLIP